MGKNRRKTILRQNSRTQDNNLRKDLKFNDSVRNILKVRKLGVVSAQIFNKKWVNWKK